MLVSMYMLTIIQVLLVCKHVQLFVSCVNVYSSFCMFALFNNWFPIQLEQHTVY
jgi:hypothetical protein